VVAILSQKPLELELELALVSAVCAR
jgi:hypothetical protein